MNAPLWVEHLNHHFLVSLMCCTHETVIRKCSIHKGAFIVNDFLRNPHFSWQNGWLLELASIHQQLKSHHFVKIFYLHLMQNSKSESVSQSISKERFLQCIQWSIQRDLYSFLFIFSFFYFRIINFDFLFINLFCILNFQVCTLNQEA